MSQAQTDYEISVFQPPLPEELVRKLLSFWQVVFQTDYEPFRGQNLDIIHLVQKDGETAGICYLTIAASNPDLGGLGEVATAPEFRGQGIASRLCARASNDFGSRGGRALFLVPSPGFPQDSPRPTLRLRPQEGALCSPKKERLTNGEPKPAATASECDHRGTSATQPVSSL